MTSMKEFVESVLYDEECKLPEPLRTDLLNTVRGNDGVASLKKYFAEHPGSAMAFRTACRDHAFRFVENEISRLKESKQAGTLTADDLCFARDELQPLLDKIEEM